jgi:hypothetical protein
MVTIESLEFEKKYLNLLLASFQVQKLGFDTY